MKIGIITFHCAHNYGAVLQAYAMQEKLKSLNHEVVIVNYKPGYLEKFYSLGKLKNYLLGQSLASIGKNVLTYRRFKKRFNNFNDFIQDKLNLSQLVSKEYLISTIDCKAFVFGSDQIWNHILSHGFDNVFWGYLTKANAAKITYAVSMGASEIATDHMQYIKNALLNFDSISVRETNIAEKLKALTNKEISTVLDPTLLVNKEVWEPIAKTPKIKKEYVLVYQVRESKNALKYAKMLAEKENLAIIQLTKSVTDWHFVKNRNVYASPEQFLGWFKQAKYVVTTSFHGTAFSLIFNRQFFTISVDDTVDMRSKELLEELNLEDRLIKQTAQEAPLAIDYTQVNPHLEKLKTKSESFLINSLKEY